MSRLAPPLALLLALLLLAPAAAGGQGTSSRCTGDPTRTERYGARGYVAYPRRAPRAIVVVGHGYSFTAHAWRSKLERIARTERAVAVAVGYAGERPAVSDARGNRRSRGWPLDTGAQTVIAAARSLSRRCRTARRTVYLGFSMGAAVGAIAVARAPRGTFDAFLGVEGIYDVPGTFRAGQVVRASNPFVDQALTDLERETGGTPDDRAAAYAARNPLDLAARVRARVRRAVLVHARDDGLALYGAAEQMRDRLGARLVTIEKRGPDEEPDTTLSQTLTGQPTDNAGHAPDYAVRHVTVRTALTQLGRLLG